MSLAAAPTQTGAALAVLYFDGRSARPHAVTARIDGERLLLIDAAADVDVDAAAPEPRVPLHVPLREVRWPERTRHGQRIAHFRSGGSIAAADAAAWDAWARASGVGESLVVRAQQSWRGTVVAAGVFAVLCAAACVWGVPWLGRAALAVVPMSADHALGEAARHSLDTYLLRPSEVPPQRQQAVRDAFANAVARADPHHAWPPYTIAFATSIARLGAAAGDPSRTRLGANAFALPGGAIVVTDDMLKLLDGRDDVLIGVLAHELGHVKRRHGMRLLVQATVLGAASSLLWGDFSTLFAAVPVLLGQSAYSRDFEREADADAVTTLRANGLSPALMAELFERLAAQRPSAEPRAASAAGTGGPKDDPDFGIAFASHPADAERIQAFRDAAR